MNPRKRIPATLTAILAILALTACGETPKGCGQGTVNNPDPGGASCDWEHIKLKDKQ